RASGRPRGRADGPAMPSAHRVGDCRESRKISLVTFSSVGRCMPCALARKVEHVMAGDFMAFRSHSPEAPRADYEHGLPASGAGAGTDGAGLASLIESRLDRRSFQQHHWEGTFWQYLEIVGQKPAVV